jgi:hypothetical protein
MKHVHQSEMAFNPMLCGKSFKIMQLERQATRHSNSKHSILDLARYVSELASFHSYLHNALHLWKLSKLDK